MFNNDLFDMSKCDGKCAKKSADEGGGVDALCIQGLAQKDYDMHKKRLAEQRHKRKIMKTAVEDEYDNIPKEEGIKRLVNGIKRGEYSSDDILLFALIAFAVLFACE